jgi:hypothetical protein
VSVSATVECKCTVVEVLEGNPDSASPSNRTVTHSLFNVAKSLDADSTPAATATANFVKALAAGAGAIDLTALPAANGVALDGTGLKVRLVRVTNLGAAALTVKAGAADGHPLFGAAGQDVPAGGTLQLYCPDGQAVDATHKAWDLAGAGAETSQWTILLG